MRNLKTAGFVVALAFLFPLLAIAQQGEKKEKKERKGEFYFSWGYNKEWYTRSNVTIDQPELGNKFTMRNVRAHDHPGWDEGLFSKAISIPQYNYRIGWFFNRKKGWGVEINFDHTKYIIADGQYVHVTGTMNNKPVDDRVTFKENQNAHAGDSSSYYFLNNGANFLLFNIVKRWHLYSNKKETVVIDGLTKAGIGPVIPHVENKFFDQPGNDPHFQLGGWNVGLEGAVRATFFKYVYLEYANKLDYARYSGLKIYKGKAKQAFGTYEMILNLGVTFPIGKREE